MLPDRVGVAPGSEPASALYGPPDPDTDSALRVAVETVIELRDAAEAAAD